MKDKAPAIILTALALLGAGLWLYLGKPSDPNAAAVERVRSDLKAIYTAGQRYFGTHAGLERVSFATLVNLGWIAPMEPVAGADYEPISLGPRTRRISVDSDYGVVTFQLKDWETPESYRD